MTTNRLDPKHELILRSLVVTQRIGSLGTLHHAEPYVSMVPFALLPDAAAFIIHVSGLSPHTRDMLQHPAVSLMVVAPERDEVPPQAVARITVQGEAAQLTRDTDAHASAQRAYVSRFPDSLMMFDLPDFSLFAIRPRSIRLIAGFAQAMTLTPDTFARAVKG
jgi:putative heme iron utilization protein